MSKTTPTSSLDLDTTNDFLRALLAAQQKTEFIKSRAEATLAHARAFKLQSRTFDRTLHPRSVSMQPEAIYSNLYSGVPVLTTTSLSTGPEATSAACNSVLANIVYWNSEIASAFPLPPLQSKLADRMYADLTLFERRVVNVVVGELLRREAHKIRKNIHASTNMDENVSANGGGCGSASSSPSLETIVEVFLQFPINPQTGRPLPLADKMLPNITPHLPPEPAKPGKVALDLLQGKLMAVEVWAVGALTGAFCCGHLPLLYDQTTGVLTEEYPTVIDSYMVASPKQSHGFTPGSEAFRRSMHASLAKDIIAEADSTTRSYAKGLGVDTRLLQSRGMLGQLVSYNINDPSARATPVHGFKMHGELFTVPEQDGRETSPTTTSPSSNTSSRSNTAGHGDMTFRQTLTSSSSSSPSSRRGSLQPPDAEAFHLPPATLRRLSIAAPLGLSPLNVTTVTTPRHAPDDQVPTPRTAILTPFASTTSSSTIAATSGAGVGVGVGVASLTPRSHTPLDPSSVARPSSSTTPSSSTFSSSSSSLGRPAFAFGSLARQGSTIGSAASRPGGPGLGIGTCAGASAGAGAGARGGVIGSGNRGMSSIHPLPPPPSPPRPCTPPPEDDGVNQDDADGDGGNNEVEEVETKRNDGAVDIKAKDLSLTPTGTIVSSSTVSSSPSPSLSSTSASLSQPSSLPPTSSPSLAPLSTFQRLLLKQWAALARAMKRKRLATALRSHLDRMRRKRRAARAAQEVEEVDGEDGVEVEEAEEEDRKRPNLTTSITAPSASTASPTPSSSSTTPTTTTSVHNNPVSSPVQSHYLPTNPLPQFDYFTRQKIASELRILELVNVILRGHQLFCHQAQLISSS